MKTKIFYFSATGNSLSVARKIAKEIDDVELISIPDIINQMNNVKGERIGFVFPVYAWGLPRIIEDFARKIKLHGNQYTFAVATCGGTPGNTLNQLHKLLKENGAGLDAGFTVKQESYTFLDENILMKLMIKIAGGQPLPFMNRLPEIVEVISNNREHRLESSSKLANLLGGLLHNLAAGQFKKAGRDFWVDKKCNLCRNCEKICPRGNIKIVDNKPVWGDDCESCFACLQWCVKEAIQYQDESTGKKRSHNGEVSLKDMINF